MNRHIRIEVSLGTVPLLQLVSAPSSNLDSRLNKQHNVALILSRRLPFLKIPGWGLIFSPRK